MTVVPTSDSTPVLLTNAQAAKILNLHPGHLRKARSLGVFNLPHIKLGGAVRYRLEDLRALININEVDPSKQVEK